jgi:FixJ family two-component response regulator
MISPGCLVLDLQLPGANGLQLQQDMAGSDAPPIIFITGHGDIPSCFRAMKAGAIEFPTKPFKDPELQQPLNTPLHRAAWPRRRGRPWPSYRIATAN